MADTGQRQDALYLRLKGAREKLCLAQMQCDSSGDRTIVQSAIDRIDLVGCTLPQWSRFDMPDGPRDVVQ